MVKDDLTRKLVLMVLIVNREKPNSSREKMHMKIRKARAVLKNF